MIAHHGVACCFVDYRNSTTPARPGDATGAFPAGLNDCASAVRWLSRPETRRALGLPLASSSRLVLAGESGGGNLAIATALLLGRAGEAGLVDGVYAMCPFIGGLYPNPRFPSTARYDGIVLSSAAMSRYAAGYGDDLGDDPLAWPSVATREELAVLPPLVVSLNEFDPLVDEGVDFYRRCVEAGVRARCVVLSGTVHGTDNFFSGLCPDISRNTASAIAALGRGDGVVVGGGVGREGRGGGAARL